MTPQVMFMSSSQSPPQPEKGLSQGEKVILHCMPPYDVNIPNPALGYLKGFLTAHDIEVRNIYWNVILYSDIAQFGSTARGSPLFLRAPLPYAATMYVCRHLLMKNPTDSKDTPLDLFFSSFLAEEKAQRLITRIRTKIDLYIEENTLHEEPLAGFTLKTQQWPMSLYIISRLRHFNPGIKILIGGLRNQSQAEAFMRVFEEADFAIWGEGEYPLLFLMKARERCDLEDVTHLVYREDGRIHSTSKASVQAELDSYPFADHSDYFETQQRFLPHIRPMVPIWGSRSCPWNRCRFCVLNEEYDYRVRSPESIIKEITFQSQKHNVETFIFVDTELPGNKKRFKKLLGLLMNLSAERKVPYHFFGEISPVFIDNETAQYMRLAFFESIQVGFEAVADSLLKKMQKRHTFSHNIQALKLGKQYDLQIGFLNILRGIPTETEDDILRSQKNLKFLRFLFDTYALNISHFVLYEGSLFYNEMSEVERSEWTYDQFWKEFSPMGVIPNSDRFEFFGFCRERSHHVLWDDFEMAAKSYAQQKRSYRWIEYEDGSFIEEYGPDTYRYVLERDETDVLVFCDSAKTLDDVKIHFSHIDEARLSEILAVLENKALLYYDIDSSSLISVVEAWKREPGYSVP
jgi:radical SAM superfamily enzyme YgiQ (UPF0313 family)